MGVGQLLENNQDEVHQSPDAATAKGHELEDAKPGIAKIKTVHPEATQEKREQKRCQPILSAAPAELHSAFNADFRIRSRL